MDFTPTQIIPFNLSSDMVFEDTGGCISSLKHLPAGKVWTIDDIELRKESMLYKGREWLIVDNLIIHESIKQGTEEASMFIENYHQTLINLAACGLKVICYNFMPLIFKVRTHFSSSFPNKHVFSLFDKVAFSVFDLYILKRTEAEKSYSSYERHLARCYNHNLTQAEKFQLAENILTSVQSNNKVTLDEFRESIEKYRSISNEQLYCNFLNFKDQILPLAESLGLKMYFNSDNPCSNLLGLPSVF